MRQLYKTALTSAALDGKKSERIFKAIEGEKKGEELEKGPAKAIANELRNQAPPSSEEGKPSPLSTSPIIFPFS